MDKLPSKWPVARSVKLSVIATILAAARALTESACAQISDWNSWKPVPGGTSFADKAVAAATTSERLHLFATDTLGEIQTVMYDGARWRAWSVVPTGALIAHTDEAPAAATFNGSVYLFCRSDEVATLGQILYNKLDNYTYSWDGWQPVPGGFTDKAVAAVSLAGSLYLFKKAAGASGPIAYTTFDGSTWGSWSDLPGVTTEYAPAAAIEEVPLASGPTVYLFVRGTDGRNHFNTFDIMWSGWSELPPIGGDTKVAGGAAGSGPYLYLFAYDTVDGSIYSRHTDGINWSAWSADADSATTGVALAAAQLHGDIYEFGNLTGAGIHYKIRWENPTFALINVIPNYASDNFYDDLNCSIGVLRDASLTSDQVVLSCTSFDLPTVFFLSRDGGHGWDDLQHFGYRDSTVGWSSGGTAYAAVMHDAHYPDYRERFLDVRRSTNTTSGMYFENFPIPGSRFPFSVLPHTRPAVQQPWLDVVHAVEPGKGPVDHVYVGFNDLNAADGATAKVHFSLDSGNTWNNGYLPVLLDHPAPGFPNLQNGPAVRVAAAKDGTTVYALFERFRSQHFYPDGTFEFAGDVVVVRDDNKGLDEFRPLVPGYKVADNIVLDGTSLSIAVNPRNPGEIYVAYVQLVSQDHPVLRIRRSVDGGDSFGPVLFSKDGAWLPSLAVADNGTVGLLYSEHVGGNIEVHFLQGSLEAALPPVTLLPAFVVMRNRTLARFPPGATSSVSYDDNVSCQDLEAVGNVFYGTFSAANIPDPDNFPSGVRFQRNVLVGGNTITRNSLLTQRGQLIGNNEMDTVPPSLDPYFFYELSTRPALSIGPAPGGPGRQLRLDWAGEKRAFPTSLPFMLEASPSLGPQAIWSGVDNPVTETNGLFSVTVDPTGSSMFYRLRRQPSGTNAVLRVNAFAGGAGSISPGGTTLSNPDANLTFTAAPNTNWGLEAWYLDGALAQTNGNTFTLSGLQDHHTVMAMFTPIHDLQLAKFVQLPSGTQPPYEPPVGTNLTFVLTVANAGLNTATGVTVTDPLPPGVNFVSASSSQGNCTSQNGIVTCNVGSLSPAASATIQITVIPTVAGTLTNTAVVSGNEPDGDPANNQATAVVTVGIESLIPPGSTWRYLDNGSDPGAAWRQQNFDDSNWSFGPAELGYGEGDELTVVNFGSPTNHYLTTYFRQTFQVDDPADFSSLLLSLKRDDGAIVYLNGIEVFRSNMPTGAVNYLTPAAAPTIGPDETAFFTTTINSNLLVSGVNLIAVEAHQVSPASDDLSFALELTGYLAGPRPPTIVQQPQNQNVKVGNPASFSVQATGTPPLSFQWFHDNAPIPGATVTNYFISSVQQADAGTYTVQVTNAVGSAFSAGASLTVIP